MEGLAAARKWISVLVETKARELEAKALFAFVAAERGWATLIGTTGALQTASLPTGVMIGNSISHGQDRVYRAMSERGSIVAAWCEEGLIYRDAADYGRRKVTKAAYDALDLFFAWGPNQAHDMVEGLGCDGRKMVCSGNPRFDVLRPELRAMLTARVDALRRRYGPFILINTNLNRYNHYFGPAFYVKRTRGLAGADGDAAERWATGAVLFQQAIMQAFIAALRVLRRAFPAHAIVIRPHPSEDHDRWRAAAADVPRVEVVFADTVAVWNLASAVAIHNNCTTGVEAYLLGRPAIAFRPVRDEQYDLRLPHMLSEEASDVDGLLALVDRGLKAEWPAGGADRSRASLVREYVSGLDGALACDRILDALDCYEVAPQALPAAALQPVTASTAAAEVTHPWDEARADRYESYVRQKCNALRRGEVAAFLDTARRATGRFAGVQVASVQRDLVGVF